MTTQAVEGAGEPLDESLVTRLRSAIRSQLSVSPNDDDDENDNTVIMTTSLLSVQRR